MLFLIIASILLILFSTSFFPNKILGSLEKKYHTIDDQQLIRLNRAHVLVLGAGFTDDKRFPANNQLSSIALARLVEAIRILRKLPEAVLITSGYSREESNSQAETFAKTAIILGVDSTRIKMQTQPHNTWAEAQEYKRLYADSTQLILVTSAYHMPRAMYLFQKAGLNPIAAPTNHLVKKGKNTNYWHWLPSAKNINKMEIAIHEYAGILWYKMGGL